MRMSIRRSRLLILLLGVGVLLLCLYWKWTTLIDVITCPVSVPRPWPGPVLIMWTRFFGTDYEQRMSDALQLCPLKCFASTNRCFFPHADAILFHMPDFDGNNLPRRRQPHQYYVFFNHESPLTYGPFPTPYPRFFNVSMAYRRDSDFVMPYAAFTPIPLGNRKEGDVWTEQQVRDNISKKSKFIVWFVSKCSTYSAREFYVRELKKYVQVDEFGKCSGKRCDRDCESGRIDDYKFVIAMENSVCRDYVTEKFWRVDRLVVPIVLRSSDYLSIAPNNSFIAVDQFENVQRLAEHLQMLNENEDEYLKYFDWTKHYLKSTFSELPMCELCAKLLEKPRPFKQYDSNSWNAPGVCETEFINKFIQ